jgi:hypothetical protein
MRPEIEETVIMQTTGTTSYLARYMRGEYERVWEDLQALGDAVRQEPLYADASAVAHETMRRARANLEVLIPRLVRVGYLFGYAYLQPPALRSFGWQEHNWYRDSLRWARLQPPLLGNNAPDLEEEAADARARLERLRELEAPPVILNHWQRRVADLEAGPKETSAALDAFEGEIGILPLSLRAWYELVGGVNFVGLHVGWLRLLSAADTMDEEERERQEFEREEVGRPFHRLADLSPLCIPPLAASPSWEDRGAPGIYHLELLPDRYSVYGEHGQPSPCSIALPCLRADASLLVEGHSASLSQTTFVAYLRNAFRWGGFPGWEQATERPERDLRDLTEGLLPL